jgi:hypothetical protein
MLRICRSVFAALFDTRGSWSLDLRARILFLLGFVFGKVRAISSGHRLACAAAQKFLRSGFVILPLIPCSVLDRIFPPGAALLASKRSVPVVTSGLLLSALAARPARNCFPISFLCSSARA